MPTASYGEVADITASEGASGGWNVGAFEPACGVEIELNELSFIDDVAAQGQCQHHPARRPLPTPAQLPRDLRNRGRSEPTCGGRDRVHRPQRRRLDRELFQTWQPRRTPPADAGGDQLGAEYRVDDEADASLGNAPAEYDARAGDRSQQLA